MIITAILHGLLGGFVIYGLWYFIVFFLLFAKYVINPIMGIINKFKGQQQNANAMGT
jgi:F0F1-type ATP synthase membrane subunit b/b'